jgi:hypothetical protein
VAAAERSATQVANDLFAGSGRAYVPAMPETAKFRPVADILERLSPDRQEEVRHRATQGDIPYLPEDVRFDQGRVYFPEIGWVAAPGMDPAKLPIDDIELLFVLARGEGFVVEVCLKTEAPRSDSYKALRRLSAFRTRSQLDKYLRKASPQIAAELLSRTKRGQLAFLPGRVRFVPDGIYLSDPEGFVEAPGLDPRAIAIESIVLLFVIPTVAGNKLEILWRTQ